ncbi:hypothetical protein I306_00527 [Cryptococcus gattii EJB2]|uniref:Uncharacterized protein n=1 Tax=Cryptococcus gattii EJB2 TaxID=1296103 RepID=A0ABR5C399_9TREE|nr:hypothetical protein I306_00527 [Cryptococcus gattii EJB2]
MRFPIKRHLLCPRCLPRHPPGFQALLSRVSISTLAKPLISSLP